MIEVELGLMLNILARPRIDPNNPMGYCLWCTNKYNYKLRFWF